MGASQCKDAMRERRGQKAEGKGGVLLCGCEPGRKENGRAGLAKGEGEMINLERDWAKRIPIKEGGGLKG